RAEWCAVLREQLSPGVTLLLERLEPVHPFRDGSVLRRQITELVPELRPSRLPEPRQANRRLLENERNREQRLEHDARERRDGGACLERQGQRRSVAGERLDDAV